MSRYRIVVHLKLGGKILVKSSNKTLHTIIGHLAFLDKNVDERGGGVLLNVYPAFSIEVAKKITIMSVTLLTPYSISIILISSLVPSLYLYDIVFPILIPLLMMTHV